MSLHVPSASLTLEGCWGDYQPRFGCHVRARLAEGVEQDSTQNAKTRTRTPRRCDSRSQCCSLETARGVAVRAPAATQRPQPNATPERGRASKCRRYRTAPRCLSNGAATARAAAEARRATAPLDGRSARLSCSVSCSSPASSPGRSPMPGSASGCGQPTGLVRVRRRRRCTRRAPARSQPERSTRRGPEPRVARFEVERSDQSVRVTGAPPVVHWRQPCLSWVARRADAVHEDRGEGRRGAGREDRSDAAGVDGVTSEPQPLVVQLVGREPTWVH